MNLIQTRTSSAAAGVIYIEFIGPGKRTVTALLTIFHHPSADLNFPLRVTEETNNVRKTDYYLK